MNSKRKYGIISEGDIVKAVFMAKGDWAGVGYYTVQAINRVGDCEARMISYTQPGSYTKYPCDLVDLPRSEIKRWWDWADVVVMFDDFENIVPLTCKPKPIIEAYNGSWYRSNYARWNVLAKNKGRIQVCMTPDLSKYGPIYISRPMDIIEHDTEKFLEFTVIHCPTFRGNKGTDRIIEEVGSLDNGVKLKVYEGFTNSEIIEFKKQAHVLIDQVKPGNGGNGYGVNALEAWAVGIPVVCDPTQENLDAIIKQVGFAPFVYPGKDETLASVVTRLKDDEQHYKECADKGRDYLTRFHSNAVVSKLWINEFVKAINGYTPRDLGKKISVCMIVKNEMKKVGTALASTRGLADEVVVVDTGSTDETVAFCRSMGCSVIENVDNMHKGKARNKCMDASSGEWEVVLDADEEIVDPFGLRDEINRFNNKYSSIAITAGSAMGWGSIPTFKFYQNRCWPKGNYRYEWRAHEVPNLQVPNAGKTIDSEMLFAHYPDRSKEHDAWKLQYTLDRLLLDVAEHPEAPRPLFYLGRQYLYLKNYDKAIDSLNKYMAMTKEKGAWDRADACFHLYQCYIETRNVEQDKDKTRLLESEAIRNLYLACLERPTNRKWWYELALFYYGRGRYFIVIGILKCMFEIPETAQEGFMFMETAGSDPYDLMARSMWHMGRYEEGLEYEREALKRNPDSKQIKENISFFARKLEALWRMD